MQEKRTGDVSSAISVLAGIDIGKVVVAIDDDESGIVEMPREVRGGDECSVGHCVAGPSLLPRSTRPRRAASAGWLSRWSPHALRAWGPTPRPEVLLLLAPQKLVEVLHPVFHRGLVGPHFASACVVERAPALVH